MMEAVEPEDLPGKSSENKPFADCLLIDGGIGQLHAAMGPLKTVLADPPMVIALAKKGRAFYIRPIALKPLRLDATHPVAKAVWSAFRDEVHRWAIGYHRNLRGRQF